MSRGVFLAVLTLVVAAPSARAQVKLESKFLEGSKSTTHSTTKTHQVLSIMGMDVETEAEESVATSSSVGKRNPDGTLPVAEKIDSIRMQLSTGGINVSYDTTDPNSKIDNPQLAFLEDVFKALVGTGYTIVLDDQNKVKFVQGTEAFDGKLEALNPQAGALLRGRLNPEKIKRSFEQGQARLPQVLARPGEPWEATEVNDIGGGQTLTFRKQYEYQGEIQQGGKSYDKIRVRALSATYAMDPNSASPIKASTCEMKVEKSEGSFLFDRQEGKIAELKESNHLKGDLTLTIQGKELPTTVDLTFETTQKREPAAR